MEEGVESVEGRRLVLSHPPTHLDAAVLRCCGWDGAKNPRPGATSASSRARARRSWKADDCFVIWQ